MVLILMILFGFVHESKANDLIVVDVRRNITLAEEDTVYKDFYINAGPGAGLKKNLVVTAVRKLNIRDASGANAVGEILVPVGQLKVIAVYDHVSVAREYTLLSRDELPMLEQIGIMSGDRIEVKGSFIDNSKPKPKQKVTQASSQQMTNDLVATAINIVTVPIANDVSPTDKSSTSVKTNTTTNPVVSAKANATAETLLKSETMTRPAAKDGGETLEKTADSGNKSLHE